MPSVPMYNRPTVTPSPRRAINVPVASEGAALAASALGTAAEAFQRERERAGRIRADAAEAEIRGIGARLGDEVSRMQRTQAFGAETMVAERWDAETSKTLAQIADPAVREMVTARSNVLRSELVERARRHGLNQEEVVRKEAAVNNITDDYNRLRTTPLAEAETIVGRIAIQTENNAREEGFDADAIAREVAVARSKARLMQVNALADADPMQAESFLQREGVLADMRPDDLAAAQKLVETETRSVRAQRGRDDIISKHSDERAALAAVRNQFEGQLEDDVLQRVRQHYADQRRQGVERRESLVEAATNAIVANNGDMTKIPANVARALQTQHAATWKNLQMFATQTATGAPLQSAPEALEEVNAMTDEALRDLDLTAYQTRLDVQDFEGLQKRQQKVRGTGLGGMTSLDIANDVFRIAQQAEGFFRSRPTSIGQLTQHAEDNGRFRAYNLAAREEIDALRQEKGRALTKPEIRTAIQRAMDDVVLQEGGLFSGDRVMPRRAATGEARELTDAERAERGLPPRTTSTAPLSSRAQARALEIIRSGVRDEAEIERLLRAEGLLSPTP